jgi:hypothetical protein
MPDGLLRRVAALRRQRRRGGSCGPVEAAHVRQLPGHGRGGLSAQPVGVAGGQVRIDPGFELYAQDPAGPAGPRVGMDDAGQIAGGRLGRGDDAGVYPVGQAADDVRGDLVTDVADEQGHGQAGHRITLGPPGGDGGQPG